MAHAASGPGWQRELIRPRYRVVSDNDYGGDPDGVVQLAQLLLSPSLDVRAVIGSALHHHRHDWTPDGCQRAVAVVREVCELAGRPGVAVFAGSDLPLPSPTEPALSAAAEALVAEAMRDDTDVPLMVLCGGGLTTVASALLLEPRIADRMTVVWIGGEPYGTTRADLHDDPHRRETNANTDWLATRYVFNESTVPLWHIPMDVFEQAQVSRAEFWNRAATTGPLGRHLYDSIGRRVDAWSRALNLGETYSLGDCPTVAVVTLGSAYGAELVGFRSEQRPRPRLDDDLLYVDRPEAAPIRVFTALDVRLMMEDLYGKLAMHAAGVG